MPDLKRFSGKVCLASGGGSGIGRSTCLRLAREGGLVAVIDIDPEDGSRVCDEIGGSGGQALFVRTDVGHPKAVMSAIQAAVEKWGKVDVVVNDAAMMTFKAIADLPDDDFNHVMDVNLRSVFLFCKYSLPHMPAGGAFVNISSVHAHQTTKNVVPYATSKGAMEAFTRGFAEEIAERKLRVNCVAPGAVDTPMLWSNPNVRNGTEKVTGAVGKPEDIAAAVCFLASTEARFITGTTLVVDGGRLDIL